MKRSQHLGTNALSFYTFIKQYGLFFAMISAQKHSYCLKKSAEFAAIQNQKQPQQGCSHATRRHGLWRSDDGDCAGLAPPTATPIHRLMQAPVQNKTKQSQAQSIQARLQLAKRASPRQTPKPR